MGYRFPEHVPRDFEDQFEWDGHGWLFRRFHRARPVRVSAEEMAQAVESYSKWKRRLIVCSIVAGLSAIAAVEILELDGWRYGQIGISEIAVAATAALAWLGRNWAWRHITHRFVARVPIGQGKTWLQDRESIVVEQDWSDVVMPLTPVALYGYLLWFAGPAEFWPGYVVFGVIALAALFDIGLKLRARRS